MFNDYQLSIIRTAVIAAMQVSTIDSGLDHVQRLSSCTEIVRAIDEVLAGAYRVILLNKQIEIPLTQGYTTIVDGIDSDLTEHKWHVTGRAHKRGRYARRFIQMPDGRKTTIPMHRIIMERTLNRALRTSELVDHIDGNGLNNSRANLRVATSAENSRNSARWKHSRSGLKGAAQIKNGKWVSSICVNYVIHRLGTFDTAEEAHEAYCQAAKELHGDFARTE